MHRRRLAVRVVLAAAVLLPGACGGGTAGVGDGELISRGAPPSSPPPGETEAPSSSPPVPNENSQPSRSALAAATSPLGSALYDETEHRQPVRPTALRIDEVDVLAPIVPVGVEPDGALEIPPAAEVGWYEPGVVPGAAVGSSVLAGHVAYNGENGAFVDLAEVDLGAAIEVYFEDGSTRRFEVVAVQEYLKEDLPVDALFARTGIPILALITCGGAFNPELRSYESNVVAYAVPA